MSKFLHHSINFSWCSTVNIVKENDWVSLPLLCCCRVISDCLAEAVSLIILMKCTSYSKDLKGNCLCVSTQEWATGPTGPATKPSTLFDGDFFERQILIQVLAYTCGILFFCKMIFFLTRLSFYYYF